MNDSEVRAIVFEILAQYNDKVIQSILDETTSMIMENNKVLVNVGFQNLQDWIAYNTADSMFAIRVLKELKYIDDDSHKNWRSDYFKLNPHLRPSHMREEANNDYKDLTK